VPPPGKGGGWPEQSQATQIGTQRRSVYATCTRRCSRESVQHRFRFGDDRCTPVDHHDPWQHISIEKTSGARYKMVANLGSSESCMIREKHKPRLQPVNRYFGGALTTARLQVGVSPKALCMMMATTGNRSRPNASMTRSIGTDGGSDCNRSVFYVHAVRYGQLQVFSIIQRRAGMDIVALYTFRIFVCLKVWRGHR
jgi:hypothetical protein